MIAGAPQTRFNYMQVARTRFQNACGFLGKNIFAPGANAAGVLCCSAKGAR